MTASTSPRPLAATITALGLLAFEIYLIHQYLLLTVAPEQLTDWLRTRYPNRTAFATQLTASLLAIAASVLLAWVVRWLTSPRASFRSWRPTFGIVAVCTIGLTGAAFYFPAQLPKVHPRTFAIEVAATDVPSEPLSEPICAFGYNGSGDLVMLEHDGHGQSRIGIDHWGSRIERTPWLPREMLVNQVWQVTIDGAGITVTTPTGVKLLSPHPPHVPNARPGFGVNEYGFSGAALTSTSRVTRMKTAAP